MTELDSAVSPVKVEKLFKRFKTQWCAMDFDSAFSKAVFWDDNGHNDNGENGSGACSASTSWWTISNIVVVLLIGDIILYEILVMSVSEWIFPTEIAVQKHRANNFVQMQRAATKIILILGPAIGRISLYIESTFQTLVQFSFLIYSTRREDYKVLL